jgi:Phosphotransferase enzyme family
MNVHWIKQYDDPVACQRAAANHRWLSGLHPSVRLPALYEAGPRHLTFERITGRHARPDDLTGMAEVLGRLDRAAYVNETHRARLDRVHATTTGHHIPDFVSPRLRPIRSRLASRQVPGTVLSLDQVDHLMQTVSTAPAALYKDANPRNVLLTDTGPVLVDFDDLTLAPFGYDLAKLIVTLTMTYGRLPPAAITGALAAYNTAITSGSTGNPEVSWRELMTWAEIHHVLTSPYLGRGGYRHSWHQHRPAVS